HLQLCVSGVQQPVRVPDTPMYLDSILCSEDFTGGIAPMLGNRHVVIVAIDGLPQESWPMMLSTLDTLPIDYRFSSRFICLDQYDAEKEIEFYRKGWQQQVFRFLDKFFPNPNARPNRDALSMSEDADNAKLEVQGGYVGAGYYTANIVLIDADADLLQDQARELRRAIQTMGFGCRIETINAVEAWLGTHPGNAHANLRRPLINTLNLADLLPFSTIWVGEEHCPCPFYPPSSPPLMVCTTEGSTPVWFNLHVGDLGHTLIFGPTGAGKSTMLATVAAQFRRYQNARIFAFDKGMSLYPLCKFSGGSHYEIGETNALAFAPLQSVGADETETAWCHEWLCAIAELQLNRGLSPGERNAVFTALQALAANPKDMRSLTDLVLQLQDANLREALTYYTSGGAMGHLLDASSDTLGISDFMVFEVESLMEMGDRILLPVLLYIFHRIEKALDGRPCLLILDEAWIMLGHPVFRAKIREWLKVLRKANCAVVLATQSLSDARHSGIMDVLAESCPTKIILPNHEARHDSQREFYTALGLNSTQIDIITEAAPKRDYYITTPKGRRLIQLALGRKTLAFVGASDRESIARIREICNEHGAEGYKLWLQERGAV
ncbi:MAG: conjugal transfer protein TrbE, partial [Desulfovibrionaceae bacterium]|nr:conjugal transfer protein TrbE [Desulfovibrionaceae bacterium]